MKIQALAVLSIIIILPMAILLNSYSSNQIKTLDLQVSYDSKLQNATYDAIKAFQLNMSNSATSDITNSKIRDLEASITTFYNSLASHFDMTGYGEDVLKEYVPAIVYTLYDGYYIYSAYDNKLDANTSDSLINDATYKDGQQINGIKPYIYYSCRYKRGSDDFVITYSLDSYITIQGIINGKEVNDSGYLLSGVEKQGDTYTYRGIPITSENGRQEGFNQNVYIPYAKNNPDYVPSNIIESISVKEGTTAGWISNYPCKKINGVKYYADEANNLVFAMLNDEKTDQRDRTIDAVLNNDNAIKYYEEAYNFKQRILNQYNLGTLTTSDAVDMNGNKYTEDNNPYPIERQIFSELGNTAGTFIEDENSNFNGHRIEVIRNSIESNLIVAISNYNKVSTSDVNFAMPKLEEYEWEQLTENISVITFLQGLNIGGKVYNGHSIVQNDINEDFVSENSIYILDNGSKQYFKPTDKQLENIDLNNAVGIYNSDFERRTALATYSNEATNENLEKNVYYYPRIDEASYSSIINPNTTGESTDSKSVAEIMKEYAEEASSSNKYQLAKLYYTALGRERYGQYRVARDISDTVE